MSITTYGWLVLLFPLAGRGPDRPHLQGAALARPRHHRHARDLPRRSSARGRHAARAAGPRRGSSARSSRSRWDYANTVGIDAQLVDPDRPALDDDVPGRRGRLDADPPLLGRLHGRRPRLHALLRLPELLRLQHAAAGPGGELLPADRRLGLRRRRVLHADLVLVPPQDGDHGRHQGVRDQRARRRRARARHVLHLQGHRHAGLPARPSRAIDAAVHRQPAGAGRGLHPAAGRRVRQVRPGPAAHLAPGRHGGPDPGLRPDPRGDDGHRRRLPDRPPAPAVRARAGRRRGGRDRRLRSRC